MNTMVEFAKRMKNRREELRLTQAQLAERVGVTSQTISAYEKNLTGEKGKTPTLTVLSEIANALDVSIDYLCANDAKGKRCEINNLADVVCCFEKLSAHVPFYVGVEERKPTLDEYVNTETDVSGNKIPETERTKPRKMVQIVIDDETLSEYIAEKLVVDGLKTRGAISAELHASIADGLKEKLRRFRIGCVSDCNGGNMRELSELMEAE